MLPYYEANSYKPSATANPSANPADRTELFETASKRFFDSFKLTK